MKAAYYTIEVFKKYEGWLPTLADIDIKPGYCIPVWEDKEDAEEALEKKPVNWPGCKYRIVELAILGVSDKETDK